MSKKEPIIKVNINTEEIINMISQAGDTVANQAKDIKDRALAAKDDIDAKIHERDNMLRDSIAEYNDSYTLMNDNGIKLFIERVRSVDTIESVQLLINSIANTPKELRKEVAEIEHNRATFIDNTEFARKELESARTAAAGAGAGLAVGASLVFMAPTAAMWVATTFGTASTGTAIFTLSGIAAQKASLAWLGGGALTAGGAGTAGGTAFLALAGPVGWSIAGATLLSTIILFSSKKIKVNKEKNEEIERVKNNIEKVKEIDSQLRAQIDMTVMLKNELKSMNEKCLPLFGKDYDELANDERLLLGTLVNNAKGLSASLDRTI